MGSFFAATLTLICAPKRLKGAGSTTSIMFSPVWLGCTTIPFRLVYIKSFPFDT